MGGWCMALVQKILKMMKFENDTALSLDAVCKNKNCFQLGELLAVRTGNNLKGDILRMSLCHRKCYFRSALSFGYNGEGDRVILCFNESIYI